MDAATKRRLLLAEDDPRLSELLKFQFAQDGFEVFHAVDGMTALDLVRREKPDLVISDVMLPRMDGFKLCRLVKFDEALKRIPFVFMTARTQDKDRETAMQAGADAYLTKPVKYQELLATVRRHIAATA